MTLKLSKLIGIDSLDLCFLDIHIVLEYWFIHYDRFREPKIDSHAPYTIHGIGME